jgi:hypothetical protein
MQRKGTRIGTTSRIRTIEDADRALRLLSQEVSRLSTYNQYNPNEVIGSKTPVGGIQVREVVQDDGSVGAAIFARTEKGLFQVSEGSATTTGGGTGGGTPYDDTAIVLDISEIRQAVGISDGDTNLGAMGGTGTIISDNGTVKAGLEALDSSLTGHYVDAAAHAATKISVTTYGVFDPGEVQAGLEDLYDLANDHITAITAAHQASAIAYDNNHSLGTTVEAAIDSLWTLADAAGAYQTALQTSFATYLAWDPGDVQGAIEDLWDHVVAIAGAHESTAISYYN